MEPEPRGSVCVQGFPVCPREKVRMELLPGMCLSTFPADVTSHPRVLADGSSCSPGQVMGPQGQVAKTLVALSDLSYFLFIYFILT